MRYHLKRILLLFTALFTLASSSVFANDSDAQEGGFNAKSVIFGHIRDAYDWHFFDINEKPVSIPLPVILYHAEKGLSVFSSSKLEHGHATVEGLYKINPDNGRIMTTDGSKVYDFSITKNVIALILSTFFILWLMISTAKKYRTRGVESAPSGFQNALEVVIIFIRDEVAKPSIGPKYMKFMPILLSMFFFIWINNMLGLLPSAANFTGNIAVTAALALVSFIFIVVFGNKHFWGHMFNPPGVPTWVKFILVPIEIISLFIKPIALAIRLFANMMAGHIIILSIISMIFIFGELSKIAGWSFSVISIAFSIFMFALELLVAAIQAFIFTNLTAVFIGQSVDEGEESVEEDYEVSENTIVA